MAKRKGEATAVAVSTGLFALAHWDYGPAMLQVLVYGAVLGWARIRSGGLMVPILLHVLINGLATAAVLI